MSKVERDGREEDKENRGRVTKRGRGGRARALAIAAPSAIVITGGRARGPGIVTPAARTSRRPRKRTARALEIERVLE